MPVVAAPCDYGLLLYLRWEPAAPPQGKAAVPGAEQLGFPASSSSGLGRRPY